MDSILRTQDGRIYLLVVAPYVPSWFRARGWAADELGPRYTFLEKGDDSAWVHVARSTYAVGSNLELDCNVWRGWIRSGGEIHLQWNINMRMGTECLFYSEDAVCPFQIPRRPLAPWAVLASLLTHIKVKPHAPTLPNPPSHGAQIFGLVRGPGVGRHPHAR